jgi:hypothetical protein
MYFEQEVEISNELKATLISVDLSWLFQTLLLFSLLESKAEAGSHFELTA